jgi:hypothetical protein
MATNQNDLAKHLKDVPEWGRVMSILASVAALQQHSVAESARRSIMLVTCLLAR